MSRLKRWRQGTCRIHVLIELGIGTSSHVPPEPGVLGVSPPDPLPTEPRLDYPTYLAERKILIDIEGEQAKSFDQAMLTLSAGALALSITFIHDIVPNPSHLGWLYGAWVAFATTVSSTLTSFQLSQRASRQALDDLKKIYEGDDATIERSLVSKFVAWLNMASITAFVVGIVLLILFSSWNLSEGGIRVITATPAPTASP